MLFGWDNGTYGLTQKEKNKYLPEKFPIFAPQ